MYDEELLTWSEHQAALLRRRAAGELVNEAEIDWQNVAEEIDQLGRTLSRELNSRVLSILIHLLKLQASPAMEPRRGWTETIRPQRDELRDVLALAPSLQRTIPAVIAQKIEAARKRVHASLGDYGEQPVVEINRIIFTEEQMVGDWFPAPLT